MTSDWIPVDGPDGHLPAFDEPVLTYCEGEHAVARRWDPEDGLGWFWLVQMPAGVKTVVSVEATHWQPLPAPPEEEKK